MARLLLESLPSLRKASNWLLDLYGDDVAAFRKHVKKFKLRGLQVGAHGPVNSDVIFTLLVLCCHPELVSRWITRSGDRVAPADGEKILVTSRRCSAGVTPRVWRGALACPALPCLLEDRQGRPWHPSRTPEYQINHWKFILVPLLYSIHKGFQDEELENPNIGPFRSYAEVHLIFKQPDGFGLTLEQKRKQVQG